MVRRSQKRSNIFYPRESEIKGLDLPAHMEERSAAIVPIVLEK
jgi:hypothetical protein